MVDDTDDDSASTGEPQPSDRLDLVRIGRLAKLGRTTTRKRSWRLIAIVLCAVASIELIQLERLFSRRGWVALSAIAWLAAGGAGVGAGVLLLLRGRKAGGSTASDPLSPSPPPPDFSTLSHGQQFADTLAAMHAPPAQATSDPDP